MLKETSIWCNAISVLILMLVFKYRLLSQRLWSQWDKTTEILASTYPYDRKSSAIYLPFWPVASKNYIEMGHPGGTRALRASSIGGSLLWVTWQHVMSSTSIISTDQKRQIFHGTLAVYKFVSLLENYYLVFSIVW